MTVAVEFRDHRIELAAALEARIKQPLRFEFGNGRGVIVEMLALPPHRLHPRNAEPAQILVDRRLVFRAAALDVDVLDPQQQPSAEFARQS